MISRRFIPLFLLICLMATVAAWTDSRFMQSELAYTRGRTVLATSHGGQVRLYWFAKPFRMGGFAAGWEWRRLHLTGWAGKDLLGFSAGRVDQRDWFSDLGRVSPILNTYWFAGMPYWFPAGLICLALLWWWWWRKHGKIRPESAFPVVPQMAVRSETTSSAIR